MQWLLDLVGYLIIAEILHWVLIGLVGIGATCLMWLCYKGIRDEKDNC